MAGLAGIVQDGEGHEPDLPKGLPSGMSPSGMVGQVIKLTQSTGPTSAGAGALQPELVDTSQVKIFWGCLAAAPGPDTWGGSRFAGLAWLLG